MNRVSSIAEDVLSIDDQGTMLLLRANHALLSPDQVEELQQVLGRWLDERPKTLKIPLEDVEIGEDFKAFGRNWRREPYRGVQDFVCVYPKDDESPYVQMLCGFVKVTVVR